MKQDNLDFLTIAIPTYSRPDKVAQRLQELSVELISGVKIVVFENGETSETRTAVTPFLSGQIDYKPSAANRGYVLNVLRCFEETESIWVWILGDDDHVQPGGLSKVMEWLRQATDEAFVTTRPLSGRTLSKVTVRNVPELFQNTSFAEVLFISATIWRRSEIYGRAEVYCDGGFSMGPNVALMLSILGEGKACASVYADSILSPKLTSHRWSRLQLISRSITLLELARSQSDKKQLAMALLPSWNWAAIDALKEIDGPDKRRAWIRAVCDGQRVIRRYTGTFVFFRSFGKHALKELVKKLRK